MMSTFMLCTLENRPYQGFFAWQVFIGEVTGEESLLGSIGFCCRKLGAGEVLLPEKPMDLGPW